MYSKGVNKVYEFMDYGFIYSSSVEMQIASLKNHRLKYLNVKKIVFRWPKRSAWVRSGQTWFQQIKSVAETMHGGILVFWEL